MSFAGAIEGLRTSRQTRRSSQMLMEIVSGISRAPDRTDLMGLRPDDQRDAKLVECKAQVASKSVWQNTAVVLRRFWMYFFLENLYTVVPLLMALVPVLAGGALANELITAMPTHAGAYDGFEELTAEHTAHVKTLAYLQAVVTPVGLYGMPAALSCTLWSWRTLLKPVLLKLMLPGFLVSLAFGLVNVSLLYDGDATLEKYSLYFQIFLLAFFLAPALVRAGNVTKNPLFGWLAMPALLMCMCMVAGHCSTVKSAPPFAGAQRDTERELTPCASSARAWWLRGVQHTPEGCRPAGRPSCLGCSSEQAASKVVDCTRFFRSSHQVQYHLHTAADRAQLDQGVLSFRPLAATTTPLPLNYSPLVTALSSPGHAPSHPLTTAPPHTTRRSSSASSTPSPSRSSSSGAASSPARTGTTTHSRV